MKKKIKAQKRVSFIRLLVGSIAAAVIVTAVFAGVFHEILKSRVRSLFVSEMGNRLDLDMSAFDLYKEQPEEQLGMICASMPLFGQWNISFLPSNRDGGCDVDADTDKCLSAAALLDKNGQIIATNEQTLLCRFISAEEFDGPEQKGRLFRCSDSERVRDLYDAYDTFLYIQSNNKNAGYSLKIESAYIDLANFRFIPHKCTFLIYDDENAENFGPIVTEQTEEMYGLEPTEVREIEIDVDDDDYVLYELGRDIYISVPFFAGQDRYSVRQELAHTVNTFSVYNMIDRYSDMTFDYNFRHCVSDSLVIGGELYYIVFVGGLYEDIDIVIRTWLIAVGAFGAVCLMIAVIWSLLRNAKNKAQYAFEDYQRTLINNLAHDMKTPLMAISGYAENARRSLESGCTGAADAYLRSILENVEYSDSIVNRTLELNHLETAGKLKKAPVELDKLAEKALEKYALMLGEKGITVEQEGGCTVDGDAVTLAQAVENLVSNAVKYTPEGGKITVRGGKSLTIVNSTEGKVDVTDIMMPFVKGDKSRNGKSGSGLGLAIVRSAADANGLKFSVSSDDGSFTAVIGK